MSTRGTQLFRDSEKLPTHSAQGRCTFSPAAPGVGITHAWGLCCWAKYTDHHQVTVATDLPWHVVPRKGASDSCLDPTTFTSLCTSSVGMGQCAVCLQNLFATSMERKCRHHVDIMEMVVPCQDATCWRAGRWPATSPRRGGRWCRGQSMRSSPARKVGKQSM